MKPYSMDFRERVAASCDAREGTRAQIAKRFRVSDRSIRKLLQRRRETESLAPLPRNSGRRPALNDRQMERLRRVIQKRPEATLQKLRESLRVKISIASLHRAIGALGLGTHGMDPISEPTWTVVRGVEVDSLPSPNPLPMREGAVVPVRLFLPAGVESL